MSVGVLHEFPYSGVQEDLNFPTPNKFFNPNLGHELYREYLEELLLADELGLEIVALPEQHSKQDNIDPSPNLVASYLIANTKRIKILPYGTILPIHNPIRVAEEYAMLDVLSGGRIAAGFVRGGPTNYLAYGMDYLKEKSKLEEAWDLIIKCWTERNPFDWNGEHYNFRSVSIWPRPLQQPHPPVHTAGGGSVEFAAKKQAGIGLGFTSTNEEILELISRYEKMFRDFNNQRPERGLITVARSVYVASTDQFAREECEKHILHQYRVLYPPSIKANVKLQESLGTKLYWATRLFLTDARYERLVELGNHIAGSPETVAEAILEQRKILDFGTFLGLFRFGDMSHEKSVRSMKLFAEQVMPKLR